MNAFHIFIYTTFLSFKIVICLTLHTFHLSSRVSITPVYPIMLSKPIDPFCKLYLTELSIRTNIFIDDLGDPFPVGICKYVVSFLRVFFDSDDKFFSSNFSANVSVDSGEDFLGLNVADVGAVVIVGFGFDGFGDY